LLHRLEILHRIRRARSDRERVLGPFTEVSNLSLGAGICGSPRFTVRGPRGARSMTRRWRIERISPESNHSHAKIAVCIDS